MRTSPLSPPVVLPILRPLAAPPTPRPLPLVVLPIRLPLLPAVLPIRLPLLPVVLPILRLPLPAAPLAALRTLSKQSLGRDS